MNGVILYINVNEKTIMVILIQKGHVVAYESRKLCPIEHNYPTHENELLAMH
jgi:hypothetical protein